MIGIGVIEAHLPGRPLLGLVGGGGGRREQSRMGLTLRHVDFDVRIRESVVPVPGKIFIQPIDGLYVNLRQK